MTNLENFTEKAEKKLLWQKTGRSITKLHSIITNAGAE
jgi:hypothetical protein